MSSDTHADQFLMGIETEYAVSAVNGSTKRDVAAESASAELLKQIFGVRQSMASHGKTGRFIENGGMFYLDCGNHVEHASPECLTPRQVALYDRAADIMLIEAIANAKRRSFDITVLKRNIDSVKPDEVTWGTHESYTCWVGQNEAAHLMVPHLASRIIYSGAGCLSWRDCGGFELSQRARHITQTIGNDTTVNRPLYGTRMREKKDGTRDAGDWSRAHLVSRDSQRGGFGVYLSYATTGLLFILRNQGCSFQVPHLREPVAAMQTFSKTRGRGNVPLDSGGSINALGIQRRYQEQCAKLIRKADVPEWAEEAVKHWGETLATLEKDPMKMAGRLDPYTKLLLYDYELRKHNRTWDQLARGLKLLQSLFAYGQDVAGCILTGTVRGDASTLTEARRVITIPDDLEDARFALKMQMLDCKYHELGSGVYEQLAKSGAVSDVVFTTDDALKATHKAPEGGRAAIRSRLIRSMNKNEKVSCNWETLFNRATNQVYDMRDPFSDSAPLVKLQHGMVGESNGGSGFEMDLESAIDRIYSTPPPPPRPRRPRPAAMPPAAPPAAAI